MTQLLYNPNAGSPQRALKVLDVNTWFRQNVEGDGMELGSSHGDAFFYRASPWAYRCARARANDISRVPFRLYRGETEVELSKEEQGRWSTIIFKSEVSTCILGAAYWLKTYEVGTKYGGLEWLVPTQMSPRWEGQRVLRGFDYLGAGDRYNAFFSLERLVYVRELNLEDEYLHGPSPNSVAREAAETSYQATRYMGQFFKTGAVPAVILSTDQNIPDPEIERVRSTWQRMFGGVKKAWQTAVLRMGLKPVVVGSPAKDLSVEPLRKDMAEEIATSFGVPVAMIQGGATAATKEQVSAYYNGTIIPQLIVLQEQFNEQYWAFEGGGLRMEFDYGQIEAIQQDEATKIISLVQAKNAGIITANEARRQINLEDKPGGDELGSAMPPGGQGSGGSNSEAAGAQEKPKAPQPTGTPLDPQQQKELRKWRNKTEARGKDVSFESDILPEGWIKNVSFASKMFGADGFDFLKQATPIEGERVIRERVQADFDYWKPIILALLLARQPINVNGLHQQLHSDLHGLLVQSILTELLRLMAEIGVEVDLPSIYVEVSQAVRKHLDVAAEQMRHTSEEMLKDVAGWIAATPTAAEADIAERIAILFALSRADNIAATELTWAMYWAVSYYKAILAGATRQGYEEIWETAEDERVCPACGPLHGKPKAVWAQFFPGGPHTTHNRCRCRIRLEAR